MCKLRYMKKVLFFTLLLFFTVLNMSGQHREITMAEAQKEAKEMNKRIILVFQGSDWCAPCIKLEKEILETRNNFV